MKNTINKKRNKSKKRGGSFKSSIIPINRGRWTRKGYIFTDPSLLQYRWETQPNNLTDDIRISHNIYLNNVICKEMLKQKIEKTYRLVQLSEKEQNILANCVFNMCVSVTYYRSIQNKEVIINKIKKLINNNFILDFYEIIKDVNLDRTNTNFIFDSLIIYDYSNIINIIYPNLILLHQLFKVLFKLYGIRFNTDQTLYLLILLEKNEDILMELDNLLYELPETITDKTFIDLIKKYPTFKNQFLYKFSNFNKYLE